MSEGLVHGAVYSVLIVTVVLTATAMALWFERKFAARLQTRLGPTLVGPSGLLQPVSTLEGRARLVGSLWPTTYYMHASVGTFTKALGPRLLAGDVLALAVFIPVLTVVTAAALRRPES